jgi:hypothetical protein
VILKSHGLAKGETTIHTLVTIPSLDRAGTDPVTEFRHAKAFA